MKRRRDATIPMSNYDIQLVRWAAHRYKIPMHTIHSVTIELEFSYQEGCPTCGPETSQWLQVYIFGLNMEHLPWMMPGDERRELLRTEEIELSWQNNFSKILAEIIEA